MFDREFSFFFAFSHSLIGNFLPRARIDILNLGQDLWQVRILVQGLWKGWTWYMSGFGQQFGVKGMPHIISMVHMQQWWLGDFMQNWSCMHLCGHSSIKFLRSRDVKAQDSFSLFKSTHCFPKYVSLSIHAFIRVYFGRRKIFTAFTLQAYTYFFQKLVMIIELFKEKLEVISFQKHVGFFFS